MRPLIFKEWLDQRYAEGRTEGRTEGEISGKRLLLQKQLERKFGLLSQELKDRLQQLSGEKLESLATALFDLETTEALRMWLARNGDLSHSN